MMTAPTLVRTLLALATVVLGLGSATAQTVHYDLSTTSVMRINLPVSQAVTVTMSSSVGKIVPADPTIADAQPITDRSLYLVGRTRVHLDRIEALGEFLELEVVLGDEEPMEQGVAEANRLMRAFGIAPNQLIGRAYVDLIRDKRDRA